MRVSPVVCVVLVAVACGGNEERPPPPATPAPATPVVPPPALATADLNATLNQLIGAGPPTIVIGTLGDDLSDRSMAAQAELMRSLFEGATVVPDTSFDPAGGPSAWPTRPVLYGGAHVNRVVAALAASLPVSAAADRIVIGGETFEGPGHRVIAAVPASATHPAFVLYAGTGTPGIVEIYNLRHGPETILIGDGFGRLRDGRWERDASGAVIARLGAASPRIEWRIVEREVGGGAMRIAFPQMVPAAADEAAVVDAIVRGMTTSATRLALAPPPSMTVYVYPDPRSKQSLTGDAGAGHANPLAMAVHVVRVDPAAGGPLELLIAHEATHVFAGAAWGGAASPLLGEGLAVWVSGHYQGQPLAAWAGRITERPPIATVLPPRAFRSRPEPETYPLAGLYFARMVIRVGLPNIRDHLYGASPETWDAACTRAGTTPAQLDAPVAAQR